MGSALPDGIPPLEETSYSRERILDALRNEVSLPSGPIAVATLYADAIEPDVIATLERARHEDLDEPSARLLFRGIHILGGRRLTSAYRPLVTLLRGPQDRVEWLLGDAITENLSCILAGMFDGDAQPLLDLVLDTKVDPYVREAAFTTMAFLAFEGRISRQGFEEFLLRFDDQRLAASDEVIMWYGWMAAIGVLGVTALEPRVRAAFADGRIAPDCCAEDDFDDLLRGAIERPDDRERLKAEQMGYIEDVLVALEKFPDRQEDDFEDDIEDDEEGDWDAVPDLPAHNPLRDIGRNDPCPCGSGKKFKKCCLQQSQTH